jgi:hypothetical protein
MGQAWFGSTHRPWMQESTPMQAILSVHAQLSSPGVQPSVSVSVSVSVEVPAPESVAPAVSELDTGGALGSTPPQAPAIEPRSRSKGPHPVHDVDPARRRCIDVDRITPAGATRRSRCYALESTSTPRGSTGPMKLARWLEGREAHRRAKRALLASVALTLLLYFVPFGRLVGYPLVLLSTVVHELGHGLVALAVGHSFERLAIYPDGSGVAHHLGDNTPVSIALISAGGLVGPAVAAAIGFAVGRSRRASRIALWVGVVVLTAVMAAFVRNAFALGFLGLVALILGTVAWRRPDRAQIVMVFLAVQLALSVFSRADYLFTEVAQTGLGPMPSDVAQIATALGGPYWVWGVACGAFSLAILAGGIAWFFRAYTDPRPRVAPSPASSPRP